MIHGMYTSALGGLIESTRVDAISHNIANLNTPGFRKEYLTLQERAPEPLEDTPDLAYYNNLVDRFGGAPHLRQSFFDSVEGVSEHTGNPMDYAISGRGFFAVRRNDEVLYTRAGNFTYADAGGGNRRLVTAEGFPVLSDAGAPIDVPADVTRVELRDNNQLYFQRAGQETEPGPAMGLADFDDYSRVYKAGDNLYRNLDAAPIAATGRLRQGTLEKSSVNPVVEMTDMIAALRSYEMNLQMLRYQDSSLDRAVNEVGRPGRA